MFGAGAYYPSLYAGSLEILLLYHIDQFLIRSVDETDGVWAITAYFERDVIEHFLNLKFLCYHYKVYKSILQGMTSNQSYLWLQIYDVLYPLWYPILCVQHEWPVQKAFPSKLAVILLGEVIVYHFYLLPDGKVFVLLQPPEKH